MISKLPNALPNRHPRERFLSGRYTSEFLSQALLPCDQWRPYPDAQDRAAWQALPESVVRAHITLGKNAARQAWPHLPALVYLQFACNGNRANYETPYFLRRDILGLMLIAECMEGQKNFIEPVADAIWSICEESSWCVPAHIGTQTAGSNLPDTTEPIVDLFAAETAALLAWCGYLLKPALDAVSPLVMERIWREVDARVLTPALERDDFWWMGFSPRSVNNWNPWINSNWLAAALLCEQNGTRRQAAVYKILESLDRFITPYPKDGGCDEGPSYWGRAGASLFDCLELLHSATAGKIDVYGEPLIREIGRFIYRTHIAGDFYVNFADAPARLVPEPMVVFHYGQRIGDEQMISFGAWLAGEMGLPKNGYGTGRHLTSNPGRVLPGLFALRNLAEVEARPPLLRDTWLGEIQVLTARDTPGTSQGLYLAVKGGHNDESHNHNDVGQYIVYIDGKPVIVDAGVETYTRKTFSSERYEIWTMQSGYHSLPTIDGVMQSPGREFAAKAVSCQIDGATAQLSLDISGAYPPAAHLKRWLRTVTLVRGRYVEIVENFSLQAPVREITFNLVTPCRVVDKSIEETITKEPGRLILDEAPLAQGLVSGTGQVCYDASQLTVTHEEIPLTDDRLTGIWGNRLVRIVFHMQNPPLEGRVVFKIMR